MTFDPQQIKRYRRPFLVVMLLFLLGLGYLTCSQRMGPLAATYQAYEPEEVPSC